MAIDFGCAACGVPIIPKLIVGNLGIPSGAKIVDTYGT